MTLQDHSQPAAAASPDPSAAFDLQASSIAQAVLAKLGEVPAATVAAPVETPVPVQVAAPEPVVASPAPEAPKADPTIDKLLARLADLETKLSETKKAPEATRLDPAAFHFDAAEALAAHGINVDLVTQQLVARALGEQASPQMQAQLAAAKQFQGVSGELKALQDQIQKLSQENRLLSLRSEIQNTIAAVDGSKYPAVAAVAKTNPNWVQAALTEFASKTQMSPADAQAALENKLAPLYKAFAPAAPTAPAAPAGNQTAPTTQPVLTAASLGGAPSPVPAQGQTWEQKTQSIMDEIVRKHGLVS